MAGIMCDAVWNLASFFQVQSYYRGLNNYQNDFGGA